MPSPNPLPLEEEALPDETHRNIWYHYNTSDTVFIFAHGLFSDVRSSWLHKNEKHLEYWPRLVQRDAGRLGDPSIFLAGYPTSVDAGEIDLRDCARYVMDGLIAKDVDQHGPAMAKRNLVFICHSTGGLVVRYMLAEDTSEFQDKRIGLLLIASPSYGSRWSNLGAWLARIYNQQLGQELAWGGPIVKDLDQRFRRMIQFNRLRHLWGQEAYETRFIFHRWWLPNRLFVVRPESAGRYFADPRPLAGLDHFTAVKPDGLEHEAHKVLVSFYQEYTQQTTSAVTVRAPSSGDAQRLGETSARAKPFTAPPRPASPFLQRTVAREAKQRLLEKRGLGLKGLVGTGKTAIAMRLADDTDVLSRYGDGVLWAGLGPDPNVLGLLGGWCAALEMTPAEIASLQHIGDRQEAIRRAIGSRQMLIVVDDAWNKETARSFFLGGAGCAHVVTTRFPTHADELVGADSAIPINEMTDQESLELIELVASGITPAERLGVTELVRAVGGLPAALILIARYLNQQRSQPDRVQRAAELLREGKLSTPPDALVNPGLPEGTWISISALIGISYHLLNEQHRAALRHLAFFPPKPNTFSQAAALSVSGKSLDVLDRLRAVGLLTEGEAGRYTLHKTIVEYSKNFGPTPDPAACPKFVEFFVNYLEIHATEYGAINAELANISAALQTAWDEGLFELFVRGANRFGAFLNIRGFDEDAERIFDQAVKAAAQASSPAERFTALLNRGSFAEKRGKYEPSEKDLVESLQTARQQGDPGKIAAVIAPLGIVLSNVGRNEEAEAILREGLALPQGQVSPETRVDLLSRLGVLTTRRGPTYWPESEMVNQEGLKLAEQVGSRDRMCFLLTNLAILELFRGSLDLADYYASRGLALAEQIGHSERQAGLLQALGLIAKARPELGKAEEWLRRALPIAKSIHHQWYTSAILNTLGEVQLGMGSPDRAREYFEEALSGLAERTDLRAHLTFNLAQVAEAKGHRTEACRLGRESLADFERMKDQTAGRVRSWLQELGCDGK